MFSSIMETVGDKLLPRDRKTVLTRASYPTVMLMLSEYARVNQIPQEIIRLILCQLGPDACEEFIVIMNNIHVFMKKHDYQAAGKYCDKNVKVMDSYLARISTKMIELGVSREEKCFYNLALNITSGINTPKSQEWVAQSYYSGKDHWTIASQENYFMAFRHEYAYFVVVIEGVVQTDELVTTRKNLDRIMRTLGVEFDKEFDTKFDITLH